MKKLFCGLLCLVLALSALASVAMAETATGSVRILANVTGGKDEEEMTLWAQALSEATGLDVTVEKPASDYNNVLMQKLSANESYDLIYLGASQYLNLVEQGALNPIADRNIFHSVHNVSLDTMVRWKYEGREYSFLDDYNDHEE